MKICHTDYIGLAKAHLQLFLRLACIEPCYQKLISNTVKSFHYFHETMPQAAVKIYCEIPSAIVYKTIGVISLFASNNNLQW